ncbi:MAG: hypothetical protein WA432_02520 [Candidatus Babeliaceae bacterium]
MIKKLTKFMLLTTTYFFTITNYAQVPSTNYSLLNSTITYAELREMLKKKLTTDSRLPSEIYGIHITSVGFFKKSTVIQALCQLNIALNQTEANVLIETCLKNPHIPITVNLPLQEVENIKSILEAAGATVEIYEMKITLTTCIVEI